MSMMTKRISDLLKENGDMDEDKLKQILIDHFKKHKNFTIRGIEKNALLPCINSIFAYSKTFSIQIKNILDFYTFIGEPIPQDKINLSKRNPYEYEEIRILFEKYNCILISNKSLNSYEKVEYICACGEYHQIKIPDFMNGHRHRCKKEIKDSYMKKESGKPKNSFEKINSVYEQAGCILLSDYNEYKNNNSILSFKCACGRIDKKSFSCFRLTKRCTNCGNLSKSGENHYDYKNGISPISEFLRKHINVWKKESAKNSNYKCMFTGNNLNLVIHHVKEPFYIIVERMFKETNIPIYNLMNMYTDEQLEELKTAIAEAHVKSGYGVLINVKIHKLFHSIYGQRGSYEDFELFKSDLLENKYYDFLKDNNVNIDFFLNKMEDINGNKQL